MTTVNDILVAAVKEIGVYKTGRSVPGEEIGDLFAMYRRMISEWATADLLRPFVTRETLSLTSGTGTYTIGTGGALNTVRPDKVIGAFVTIGSTDYPLRVDNNMSTYNDIQVKDTQGTPSRLFYDNQYSLGKLYLYYVPDQAMNLTLESTKPVVLPTAVTDTFNMPPECENLCIYSLAVRAAPSYGLKAEDIASTVTLAGQLVAQMKAKNIRVTSLRSDSGNGIKCQDDTWKAGL